MRSEILVLSTLILSFVNPMNSFSQEKPESVQVNFEDVNIKDFTKIVSQTVGKNIIIPPSLRGKITIVSPKPIPKKQFFNLFVAALDELGYQIVDYGSYIKIVRSKEAARESASLAKGRLDGGDRILTLSLIHISEPTRPY
jgi:general secretion pathway protein D